MGSSCSKRDHVISQSRQAISETHRRPRKAKHEKEKQSEHSLAWFERCNIGVEFWGTAAKRLLPKKSAPATGCKYVIICRITMEKKQLAQGTIVTKKESKLNCVLRMPELEWGAAIVKLQLPKLLPLNLWPGETYVFGFLQSDNQATSNITLVGKVGNEDVRITQPVIHNPNFSTEIWKQLGDILTAEMNKHKKILSKEISKCDVKQKHSRDTGYNTTSQRYSSDASQKAHSHRKEESTDSDDNTWIDSETRRSRRNDAAHSSPTNRPVQTSYKRKVEESKVVEETESRSKSTDDSKSQSSGEKQFVTEEQLDTKETPFKQASANKTVQQTATPLLHTAEANYFGSDKKYSFDSQKSVAKTDKKRSSIAKRSSFPLTLTEASKPLEKPNLKKENCARAQETETEGWLDDRDADDESDEIIETPSGSPEKGDTLALSDCIVRPKTPVPLDQGDEARGNDKANKVKANNDKAPNTKRISISEIMEKQEMQSPIKSPQQKLNEDVLPLKINNEDSLIRVLSPKAQYFAMHHYGNITSSNSVESPSADQEGRSFHNVDICCEDAKVMCNVNDNTGASGTSSQLNTTERDSRNNPSAKGRSLNNGDITRSMADDEANTDLNINSSLHKECTDLNDQVPNRKRADEYEQNKGNNEENEKATVTGAFFSKEDKNVSQDRSANTEAFETKESQENAVKGGKCKFADDEGSDSNMLSTYNDHISSRRDSNGVNSGNREDNVHASLKLSKTSIQINKTPKDIRSSTTMFYQDKLQENRYRTQSVSVSNSKDSLDAKYKRYNSEQTADRRKSTYAKGKGIARPVQETVAFPEPKEAFIGKLDQEGQNEPGKRNDGRTVTARRPRTLDHQIGRRISNFYRQPSKLIRK